MGLGMQHACIWRTSLASAAFLGILLPNPGHAEDTAIGQIILDTITVTATKTEESVIDTLAGASVVTQGELDRIQPDRPADIFVDMPGVSTAEEGDDPSTAINIRGLQDFGRVNVMIEGARQNFQRSGHGANGFFYLEPELVRQVDVVRGPVSTIYGSGAIGGVVNFQLKDAADLLQPDETVAAILKSRYNTNDDGVLLSATGVARPVEAFDVLANVVWRDHGDYKDGGGDRVANTHEDVVSALVKGTLRPADGHELKVSYLHNDNDYVTGTVGSQRETDTVDRTAAAKWHFDGAGNPLVDLTVSTYYTSTDTNQVQIDGAAAGARRSFTIDTVGGDAFNTSRFETGNIAHKLTYGGDFFRDKVRNSDPAGNGDELTPSGERMVYGAFLQDQLDYGDWLQVIGAVRFDSYELKSGSIRSDGSRLSPKVTVGVTPIDGIQFFATYAEGYRAPAVTETLIDGVHPGGFAFALLPNPNLRPETAHNWEGGVNLKFDDVITDGDAFRAKAVYFHNDVDDYIDGVYSPLPAPFGQYQYQNVAKARLKGVEIEGTYDTGDIFVRAAYSRVRGDNRTDGQPLLNVFPEKFSTTAGVRLLDHKLTLSGRWTAVAAQKRVPTGTPPSEAYDLFDLFATYEHSPTWSTSLSLKNLLDKDYTSYLDQNPSPGFSAGLTVTLRLGG